jgi:fimbrial chaperone protein
LNTPSHNRRAAFCSPAFWLGLGLLLTAHLAVAGVQISPTLAQLDANNRVAALTLSNSTARDISFQIELAEWTQVDGQDHYEPSTDLLATPPIFTLSAGSQQIIRVGLRRAPERDSELSYRVFIQELPPPAPEGFTGLQMVLRLGIPLFVAPAAGTPAHDLAWRLIRDDDGATQLVVDNRGNGHARVTNLVLELAGETVEPGGMFYVLPGSSRSRQLPATIELDAGAEISLSARIDRQPFSTRVRVE